MATVRVPTPGEGNGVAAFFERCGLLPDARLDCLATVSRHFPGSHFEEASPQGYCSYTLCDAGLGKVVQFRPSAHRVDPRITEAARAVYADLAPKTELLETLEIAPRCHAPTTKGVEWVDATPADEGIALDDDHSAPAVFQVISMSMTPGIPLAQLRAAQSQENHVSAPREIRRQRESLVVQFARFVARGWEHRRPSSDAQARGLCGRVGSSMRWRLEQMRARLPRRFRSEVQRVLDDLEAIRELPWVLTHGDVVPANLMVRSHNDWTITGFLDWAEAEYLPFGVGLYGLEETLGEVDNTNGQLIYYPEAASLRELFWSQLETELQDRGFSFTSQLRRTLGSAHALGVLLWHGIAFDNGKLDRVVEEGRDQTEVQRLDSFFQWSWVISTADCYK